MKRLDARWAASGGSCTLSLTRQLVIKVLTGKVLINDAHESCQSLSLASMEDDEQEGSNEIHCLTVAVDRVHVDTVGDQYTPQLLDLKRERETEERKKEREEWADQGIKCRKCVS